MKYLIPLVFVLAACAAEPIVDDSSGTFPADTPTSELCANAGGLWIESAQECEGIAANVCQEMGGQFNECASACRNDPDAEFCTMQCVLVCEFRADNTELFAIGPELKDCVGVGPQQCMVVNGEFFYDSIHGFDYVEGYEYELLVRIEERENVPADANKYVYTLVEIQSQEIVIPESCSVWFDGCNNCIRGENGVFACTKKMCFEKETPRCVE